MRWSAGSGANPETVTAAISALVESLEDPDTAVRLAAIESLHRLPWAVPVSLPEAPNQPVSTHLATTALPVDPQSIAGSLADAVADPDPLVREHVIEELQPRALGNLSGAEHRAKRGDRASHVDERKVHVRVAQARAPSDDRAEPRRLERGAQRILDGALVGESLRVEPLRSVRLDEAEGLSEATEA